MTMKNWPPSDTVAASTNTVTGWVEYSYWMSDYVDASKSTGMSAANWELFKDVKMYVDKSDTSVNFESLFMLYDPAVSTTSDPLPNSLFNLDTLKKLISLGQAAGNLLGDEKDQTWASLNLSTNQDWIDLSNNLDFNVTTVGQTEDPEIGVKRTYLLWLWMETLFNETIQRLSEGGSF